MTHIKTYTTKDGKVVQAHEDSRKPAGKQLFPVGHKPAGQGGPALAPTGHEAPKHPATPPKQELEKPAHQGGWKWSPGVYKKPKPYPNAKPHPFLDDKGEKVYINEPSKPTEEATWADPKAVATWTPGSPTPQELNGVPFAPWQDTPETPEEWDAVEGQDWYIPEPEFKGPKAPAAGVIVEEDDGRVWVIHPTNRFGGYSATFPKGHVEEEINLQASAIKEAYEESGLKVEITGFFKDVERSTTTCRYYTARRVGGTPAQMGWESQAVSLVPRNQLYEILNSPRDWPSAAALGAGPMPKLPEPPPIPKYPTGTFSTKGLFGDGF